MKWNKCADILPDPGIYLIYVKENTPHIYIDGYGYVSGEEENNPCWAHELMFNTKVTHWMPLPEKPNDLEK